jgi:hypothetical protein
MNDKIVVNEIVLLAVIVERKQKNDLIDVLSEAGGQLINTIYGKEGLVKAGYLREALGLVPEDDRVIVTCLLPSEESDPLLETLAERFSLDEAHAGAAFTLPVEKLSF